MGWVELKRYAFVLARVLLLVLCAGAPVLPSEIRLSGHVVDDNSAPVAGARITVSHAEDPDRLSAISDPAGGFVLALPVSSEYRVRVEKEGHYLVEQTVSLMDDEADLTFTLPRRRQVVESVDVTYSPPAVDPERVHLQTLVTGNELLDIPYPKTNELRNAVRVLPGVIQDSQGGLHINGGTEEQTLYTLDGFTMNDPLSGRLETRLSVEAVRAFDLRSGSLPAEHGKGAAGALAIRTEPGSDVRRFTATNFVPGMEYHKGVTIGAWTPRFGVSGPIVKGRAWVSDSMDIQYTNTVIDELPKGQDRSTSWRGSNLLRTQVNLTDANIVNAGLLGTWWTAKRTGLSAIDALETTADRRQRSYFFHIKDQIASRGRGVTEIGYAAARTFGREIPQGDQPLIFTPYGLRGNYMLDGVRNAGRDQLMANSFLPTLQWLGRHQIKIGGDFNWLRYQQNIRRSGFDFQRADGTIVRQTRYGGGSAFQNSSREISSYIQDSWRVQPWLLLELGLRQDWDALVQDVSLAPRIGAAWGLGEATKIAGGYSLVYEPGNLRLFSEPLDQYSISTSYPEYDRSLKLLSISAYQADRTGLRSPRYHSWNVLVEHQLSPQTFVRGGYLRRRGWRGLTYLPGRNPAFAPFAPAEDAHVDVVTHQLTNLRTDIYDAVEFLVRQTFRKQYEYMVSYTRSRALSNSVTDVRIDNPILSVNNAGPMPWDAPNRMLSWGYLPAWSKDWAVAYMLEWRTGLPFSVNDELGNVMGRINDHRYPMFFELNTHLERRFSRLGYRWAFRFGVNNITNHKNPNVVINTMGAPNFMQYFGGQRRAFNFRIRWLGKL